MTGLAMAVGTAVMIAAVWSDPWGRKVWAAAVYLLGAALLCAAVLS